MKRRKIFLYIGASILCSLPLVSKADFSGFVEQLRESNIPVDKILTQTGISRYEITRLLNATECKDCVNPDNAYLKRYSEKYWSNFTAEPGQYFDDINYEAALYKQKSYYYCVAYVGENGYMRGYPRETSPICAGEFCGTRLATKAEFLQIVMNIIGKYIYNIYALNWQDVQTWINKQDQTKYAYRNFSSKDISLISDKAKVCKSGSCSLETTDELNIYLKYCMFNLEACGMSKMGKIGEGSWPVAELNLLQRQQVINLDEAEKFEIGELIDGELVVNIFSKVNDIVGCAFDNDYDCDGIPNTQDSCPNTYSPHQTDTDKDGIGDVCDDDIDGDSIKNPIGIVDDNGRIVVERRDSGQDNCLFIVNKDQKQSNSKILGNACIDAENLSLAIQIDKVDGSLPQTIGFSAIYNQGFESYTWDFGDGSVGSGKSVNHTYTEPGLYLVRLVGKTSSKKQALAKTTVLIGESNENKRALQAIIKSIAIKKDTNLSMALSQIGKVDYLSWYFGTGSAEQSKTNSLSKVFRTQGNIPVTVKGYINNQVVVANAFTIAVGDNAKGALLNASILNPNKGETVNFNTTVAGFSPNNITTVTWNFGDGETMQTQSLSTSHTYKVSGQKAVVQTITLSDGSSLRNIITLFVVRPYQFTSLAMSFLTPTIGNTLNPSKFSTKIIGSFDTPLFFTSNYGDGKGEKFSTKNIKSPFNSQHQYSNPSVFYPQTNMMLDVCTSLSAQATIDVQGTDLCLDAKANGTLKNLGCDMDKDSIADICDQDIDGDGKPNLLGLLSSPNQCNYNAQLLADKNNNNNNLINHDVLNLHFKGVCSLDNDPFNKNADQADNNNNKIGDSLDAILAQTGSSSSNTANDFLDTDNDGIGDNADLCPLLAETYNTIQDNDGCPEIGVDLNCENSRFPSISDGLFYEPTNNCGNGKIDPGETCQTCPSDVGVCNPNCGNGKIDPGETCSNCPSDAGVCGPNCGNGKIDPGETCQTCPSDVGVCITTCGNEKQEVGETCENCPTDVSSCTPSCGNTIQEAGETCTNCPTDSKYCGDTCGNNTIDNGETCQSCPVDVQRCFSLCGNGILETNLGEQCDNGIDKNGKDGLCTISCKTVTNNMFCGNGKIDPGETCQTCPADLGVCISICGNGKQEVGETCENCPTDVSSCTPSCGNTIQEAGETCKICPADATYCGDMCGNNTIDNGETCQSCPVDVQRCFSLCGNGILETNLGEQCDNGIDKNGKDGLCSSTCKTTNTIRCGNGVQDIGEDCLTCPQDSKGCLIIATKECNQCPCPYADFSAALNNGDQIKAVLWDINKTYPWKYSAAYEIGY